MNVWKFSCGFILPLALFCFAMSVVERLHWMNDGFQGVSLDAGNKVYLNAGSQSGTWWIGMYDLNWCDCPDAVAWDGGLRFRLQRGK